MAKVYLRAHGYKLEKLIGKHDDVQDRLDQVAGHIARRARGVLAAHRHKGHAEIEGPYKGSKLPDRYIVLSDERGQSAAMSIEFGRGPRFSGDGNMLDPGAPPVAPLRLGASMSASSSSRGSAIEGGGLGLLKRRILRAQRRARARKRRMWPDRRVRRKRR